MFILITYEDDKEYCLACCCIRLYNFQNCLITVATYMTTNHLTLNEGMIGVPGKVMAYHCLASQLVNTDLGHPIFPLPPVENLGVLFQDHSS